MQIIFKSLDEFLIKLTNKDNGDPYIMVITIMNLSLIDFLALSVSNPRCGLDGAQVNSHTTNKINEVIHYTHVQVLQKCSKFHDLLLFGKLT